MVTDREKAESPEAFPYDAPSQEVKHRYNHIFSRADALPSRWPKVLFDRITGLLLFICSCPILAVLKMAYVIEGLLIPRNRGPMLFYYWGISEGQRIKKWKLRLIKAEYIDAQAAEGHEWRAYSAEWNAESRTIVGAFAKKWHGFAKCCACFCTILRSLKTHLSLKQKKTVAKKL